MDVHFYIKQLYDYVNLQQQEIASLKQSISNLTTEMKQLKEKPSVTVERLEYKFDQLKVETLEGTLNIGLNPSDLTNMDDFSVPTPTTSGGNPLLKNISFKRALTDKLDDYLNNQLDTIINDNERQIGRQLDSTYTNLIRDDILKQLPARIDHYIYSFGSYQNDGLDEEQLFEKIYNTIVADIHKAVHSFITQMPNSGKGMNS